MNKNNFPWETGFTLDFDLVSGLSEKGVSTKRYLSQMKGFYYDSEAEAKLLESDPMVYEFYELNCPEVSGDLAFGTTIVYPGKVNDEYYMTKGHFHVILDTAEVYYTLSGRGILLCESPEGDVKLLEMKPGAKYIVANGRYLYVPTGVKLENGTVMVPVRTLCQALGAEVVWNGEEGTIIITSGSGPIASGDSYYDQEDLYWLSRIIYAESGNQSLEGKIAVGNVVLNRVASTQFPNTVYGVIFQRNQFTPASNGRINRTPTAECVIAAKLALEGANTAGNALYFINPSISSSRWFSRNCTYVATIGAHAFFA